MARRSVGGRKEVPVRGPPLAFLCIFHTSLHYLVSTLPFPPAHFLYLQASRDSSCWNRVPRSIVSPFAIDATRAGKPPSQTDREIPDEWPNFRQRIIVIFLLQTCTGFIARANYTTFNVIEPGVDNSQWMCLVQVNSKILKLEFFHSRSTFVGLRGRHRVFIVS